MKVKNLNSSSRKTKLAIRDAFIELIDEKKEIDKITVTELVKRANITRSTFYTHYSDIYEIAKELEDEIVNLFINEHEEITNAADCNKYIDSAIAFIKEHEDGFRKLISGTDSNYFFEKLKKKISVTLENALCDDIKKNDFCKLDIDFIVDGLFNLIVRYFKCPSYYSLDEINESAKRWVNNLIH